MFISVRIAIKRRKEQNRYDFEVETFEIFFSRNHSISQLLSRSNIINFFPQKLSLTQAIRRSGPSQAVTQPSIVLARNSASLQIAFNINDNDLFAFSGGGSMFGDVNISAILDSFSISYDKRVRPNYGGEYQIRYDLFHGWRSFLFM